VQNRKAVSIALVRELNNPEFYLVKRNPDLKFFGDYYAFPGGTLDAADSKIPVDTLEQFAQETAPYIVSAVREVFEETGILITNGQDNFSPEKKARYRNLLLNGKISFNEILSRENLSISSEPFRYLGKILTPEFAPVRYDTNFFLVEIPSDIIPEIIPGELVDGVFYTPEHALSLWKEDKLDIVPPVIFMFFHFLNLPLDAAIEKIKQDTIEYRAGKIHQIYFSPGIQMAPLKTRPIPPATHTNCYIIGERRLFLLDPGASEPSEQERLLTYLDTTFDETHRLEAILLSHHHPDHIGAAALCSNRYNAPIYAHSYTAVKLPDLKFERLLQHGDALDLGESPDGRDGWKLQVFHTPGHAQGHLAFRENRYGALLAGDMLSTLSTIVIDPDEDGDMISYIKSLELLEQVTTGMVYPAHGPAVKDGQKLIRTYIRHRAEREQKVLRMLHDVPITSEELVAKVYDDVDAAIWPVAEKSLRASLLKLINEGKCKKSNNGYILKK